MARKVIMLVGAPENHTLDWAEAGLLNSFLEPIAKFALLEQTPGCEEWEMRSRSTPDAAVWRSIPLRRQRLATGFSQAHEFLHAYHGDGSFFVPVFGTPDTDAGSSYDETTSQRLRNEFYDHSIAVHDDIPSSQLPTLSFNTSSSSMEETTAGLSSGSSSYPTGSAASSLQPPAIETGHLSDLEDLPSASYLESISPQTMTVNIIVGIISIAEPRTVKTRWGSTKSLVELLVGDETKSGFSITFWLPAEASESSRVLRNLRRQDIVLLRNVALSTFMKKVHGHSLRKGLTRIDLLHRRRLDREDPGGLYSMRDVSSTTTSHPQLMKTRRVREWALDFVGQAAGLGKRKQNGKPFRSWDMPPDDTQ
ncbi:hypothetical protein GGR56DRAFT_418435 [Xylariaceae sp. FL0804]|nr:hypothetical protein GGR56DRAFT_418435 [Xylariaceae sp. FL0804]